MYTIEELTAAANKIFGMSGALVETALKLSGKEIFELGEAKELVKKFSEREVKN